MKKFLSSLVVLCLPAASAQATSFWSCNKQGQVSEVTIESQSVVQVGKMLRGTTAIPTAACDLDPATGRLYWFEAQAAGARRFGYWVPGGANGVTTIVKTFSKSQPYMKRMACGAGVSYCYLMDNSFHDGNHNLYKIDKASGNLTLLGSVPQIEVTEYPEQEGTGDMTYAADGTLYVTNLQNVYSLDPTTLTATLLHAFVLLPDRFVITGVASCGGTIYASLGNEGSISHIRILDPVSGTVTHWLENQSMTINDLAACAVP